MIITDESRFAELVGKINQWGIDRGLTLDNGADPSAQVFKLLEEAQEVGDALEAHNVPEIIDGIGDCLVVLIQLSRLTCVPLDTALEYAWKEIKNRGGQMKYGIFVKEQDLERLKHRGVALEDISSKDELEFHLTALKSA